MMKPDYIKLSVTAPRTLHDAEASSKRPRFKGDRHVTTWTWTFETPGERAAAVLAAQAKRKALRDANPDIPESAFALSTFRVGSVRGVPGVSYVPRAAARELQAVAS